MGPDDQERRATANMGKEEALVYDAVSMALARESGQPVTLKRANDTMILPEATDAALLAIQKHRSVVSADSGAAIEGSGIKEKKLAPIQKTALYRIIARRLRDDPERYKDIEWESVMRALEGADESVLRGIFEMEGAGHKVGVSRVMKDGRSGFRFDSCSESSPIGSRGKDYGMAEGIAVEDWGVDLMDPNVYEEFKRAGIISNEYTWDYLKTDAETVGKGFALTGNKDGLRSGTSDVRHHTGGFRCSTWIPEV